MSGNYRTPDPDLERLLRSALRTEADRQHPKGDGLALIRDRVAGRRRWRNWLAPTVALIGAATVIAAAVAAPTYLAGSRSVPQLVEPAGPGQPGGQPVPLSPTGPPTSGPATAPLGSPGTPYGTDYQLADMATVWPYPSRRTGYEHADDDVRNGVYPRLADPADTAVDFIAAFVGSDTGLSARRYDARAPGIRMLVTRRVGTADMPVSLVFLVRVRVANDSPYVVVGASRAIAGDADSLTISPPPKVVGTNAFTVGGVGRANQGQADRTVIVQLREPGSSEALAQQTAALHFDQAPQQTWNAELTPLRPLSSTGVVAAWTLDPVGKVVEFVAAPTEG